MFNCCGHNHKGFFKQIILRPYYRMVEYGVCQECGTRYFVDYRQYEAGKEVVKEYKNKAADKQYTYWNNRINSVYQGTRAKEHFYYGYYTKNKKGYYDTYRMNFNNKKEFLFEQHFRKET